VTPRHKKVPRGHKKVPRGHKKVPRGGRFDSQCRLLIAFFFVYIL
jgi:hypothetical protein